ncbi:hypothetical protein EVG59_07025 [Salmonella enterica subsp. enterica serovar Dortmund]|nr:hypothetical protein [Salmonella enterica subsp. enterica serovar Dortmund]ECB1959007.1 hypothetical protein [Salmonella enterica subsp. enterica serovar Dortmund]
MAMNSNSVLQKWANKIAAASHALEVAEQVLKQDKAQRQSSMRGLFVDWLTTTPAERGVEDKRYILERLTKEGREAASQWVLNTTRTLLRESPDAIRYEEHQRRLHTGREWANRFQNLLILAESAQYQLQNAESACSSASTVELLDLLSKNKGISVWSHIEASNAKTAIEDAATAIKKLSEAMPGSMPVTGLDKPDDLLDLFVDLTISPTLDVLSWFNMETLTNIKNQCHHAMNNLYLLLSQLNKSKAEVRNYLDAEERVLRAIETPYLDAAMAQVPVVIRCPMPTVPH